MNRKRLAVFDLDGTLILHDSFAELILRKLPTSPRLLLAALMRKAGLTGRAEFAAKAHAILKPAFEAGLSGAIVNSTLTAVIVERQARARELQADGCHIVLLSASPADYVKPLADALGFDEGFGSCFQGDRYLHLHGQEKKRLVEQLYPESRWRRVYAMADQPSDEPLLSLFENAEWV